MLKLQDSAQSFILLLLLERNEDDDIDDHAPHYL